MSLIPGQLFMLFKHNLERTESFSFFTIAVISQEVTLVCIVKPGIQFAWNPLSKGLIWNSLIVVQSAGSRSTATVMEQRKHNLCQF